MEFLWQGMLERCGVCRDDRVLVGFSGGGDSTALLLGLLDACRQGFMNGLAAAHLHHGIRGEAAEEDAAFCRALCESLGVPFVLGRADVPGYAKAHGMTLEQAGRILRYEFLQKTMEETGCTCIAVAHHLDDQAETLLLHLLRGCGTAGLCAMRYRTGCVVRPLLGVERKEIEAYLKERRQPYRTDETNRDLSNTRNRVRQELMPLLRTFNPQAARALSNTAALAAEDEAYLMQAAETGEAALSAEDGGLDRAGLSALAAPIAKRILLKRLLTLSRDVTGADIRRVYALAGAQTGTRIQLREGYGAWVDANRMYVGRLPEEQVYSVPFLRDGETRLPKGRFLAERAEAFRLPENGNEAYVDLDELPENLTVRTRRPGDRFYPLGSPGDRKLSDYLTDRKIPRGKRDMPLLAAGNRILFVVGGTVAESLRVKPDTKRILRIVYEEGYEYGDS